MEKISLNRAPCAFDIIGFDLDGTLLDTSGDLAAAVNFALKAIGRPAFPAHQIGGFVGRGARVLLERALAASGECTEALVEQCLPQVLDYYGQNLAIHTLPYPGMVDALDALSARGLRLAVCTNKSERFTLPLLEQLGLSDRFASVVCGDTLAVAKPDPAPILEMVARAGGGRALFIGDTINDIAGARAAGLPNVAVAFGFLEGPVGDLQADAVIHHFDELPPLVESWPS